MKRSEFVCTQCGRSYTLGIENNSIVFVKTLVSEAERGPMPIEDETIEDEKGNDQRKKRCP